MNDVVVIGAGMAGLVCAQQLSQAGYSVLVVEKSRGLGGRLATRRLHGTWADHGACYLKSKGELFTSFVELLRDRHILEVWTDQVYELQPNVAPRYVAPAGMSAIAKFIAQNLNILLNQRVTEINLTPDNLWRLTLESSNEELTAKALVIAIPAPQALMLLTSLGEEVLSKEFLTNLSTIEFSPCISAIAGYPTSSHPLPDWKALNFVDDAILGWIGLDSSKRSQPLQPVFVLQSSANFAQLHLESSDLQPSGKEMLSYAAQALEIPWLDTPDWLQVHRWRYAFPSVLWQDQILSAQTELPLVCCGDWCGGNLAEGAMLSGLAASVEINNHLNQLLLPDMNFLKVFT
ncbi:NAD(P)/FAD-dependent oxidoreductase [Anabaena subtropica]|uniref:NAD(P)/FAD-dependent oxidoreductase n=1 Tax=Anabaena subtropica FACHB-260 TaxID=2692884 RepID=A0ABR8CLC4_9NOST|nr:NAD(P)/FAD-dependent oxidoreductase [Anabaena subtropica]MBD2344026.1 NAD(P)/FAD-dependent oxidoreductase [Anabaena subtropica FACHB-260]